MTFTSVDVFVALVILAGVYRDRYGSEAMGRPKAQVQHPPGNMREQACIT
jgi:hypothetical protein